MPQAQIDEIRKVAVIVKISGDSAKRSTNLHPDEPPQYGGYAWYEKNGMRNGQSFRCPMAAYVDAQNVLIRKATAPLPTYRKSDIHMTSVDKKRRKERQYRKDQAPLDPDIIDLTQHLSQRRKA